MKEWLQNHMFGFSISVAELVKESDMIITVKWKLLQPRMTW